MKKIIAWLFVIILITSTTLPCFAESANIQDEMNSLLKTFQEKKINNFLEVFIFTSVNLKLNKYDETVLLTEATPYSDIILARLAMGKDPYAQVSGENPIEALQKSQTEEGSFGENLYQHYLSIIALESVRTLKGEKHIQYSTQKAVDYVLSMQNEDGSFGSIENTGIALCALSEFNSDVKVKLAIEKAIKFLNNAKIESLRDLCYSVQGLIDCSQKIPIETMQKIIAYKKDDGTYSEDNNLLVVATFDTFIQEKTPFKRIAEKGTLNTMVNIVPIFIGYAVLATLSLAFWAYIMFSKKIKKATEKDDISIME